MQRILNHQNSSGLFPTIGRKGDSKRTLESVYLHSFVLEYLIDNHSSTDRDSIQKGLDFLLAQAIEYDGRLVWQWLKNPPTTLDYHPPDTDDTIRARLIIEKAQEKGFRIPERFRSFDYGDFFEPLRTPGGAVLTYMGGSQNNVCPEVNANVLHALTAIERGNPIREGIRNYLTKTVNSGYLSRGNFKKQSKYFMSPYFLAYVLSKIFDKDPGCFSSRTKRNILDLATNNAPGDELEKAWYSITARNCGSGKSSRTDVSFDDVPIFHAKSLREVYSSPVATGVFCLESNLPKEL